MPKHLPPMSALRGFEAAGRLGSFSDAADELGMSQSAVSHQIKGLEDFLGQPLFKRVNRSALLTDAGQAFLETVKACLDLLEDGVQQIEQYKKPGQIIVSVTYALGSRWLLPRLAQFRSLHPDLDVWLHTSDRMLDFERGEVHAAIWLGDGKWPGREVTKLFDEELVPLCAPQLLAGQPDITAPTDLFRFTLLHDERRESWDAWFTAMGFQGTPPIAGPNFSDSGLLLQAAADGQGIALGSRALAAADIAAGRLVVALDRPLKSRHSYYLISSDISLARPSIRTFHDWLIADAAENNARQPAQPDKVVSITSRKKGRQP